MSLKDFVKISVYFPLSTSATFYVLQDLIIYHDKQKKLRA